VEFTLAIVVFLTIVVGLFDLGRAIYVYNGTAEAAREIARRTIVHPGTVLGTSPETQDVIATQRALLPGFGSPTFSCVDVAGAANGHVPCRVGDYVRVTVSASYPPAVLLGLSGPVTLSSAASMLIP